MELQKNKEGSTKENPKLNEKKNPPYYKEVRLKLGPLNEQANEQKFQITQIS